MQLVHSFPMIPRLSETIDNLNYNNPPMNSMDNWIMMEEATNSKILFFSYSYILEIH
jgi:hypothetical protein